MGSTIRTGSDGEADIITTPGSAIHLGPDSNLRINALAFAKSGGAVTERQAHLQLNSGVVSALIDPSTPKVTDFQVQTPEGSAAARGTFTPLWSRMERLMLAWSVAKSAHSPIPSTVSK